MKEEWKIHYEAGKEDERRKILKMLGDYLNKVHDINWFSQRNVLDDCKTNKRR